jgi:hypothetical protein
MGMPKRLLNKEKIFGFLIVCAGIVIMTMVKSGDETEQSSHSGDRYAAMGEVEVG